MFDVSLLAHHDRTALTVLYDHSGAVYFGVCETTEWADTRLFLEAAGHDFIAIRHDRGRALWHVFATAPLPAKDQRSRQPVSNYVPACLALLVVRFRTAVELSEGWTAAAGRLVERGGAVFL